jgi:hypothetical protein
VSLRTSGRRAFERLFDLVPFFAWQILKAVYMAKSKNPTATAPVSQPAASSVTEEAVRERARELYEQRGRQDGHALDDWLAAESEIITPKADIPLSGIAFMTWGVATDKGGEVLTPMTEDLIEI